MQIRKILIFNPFGIGDVLFTTPLIRNLKENLRECSISYIANRRTESLLEHNPYIDKVFVFEKDELRNLGRKSKPALIRQLYNFYKQIKKESYDVVFDLSMNQQYGFFLKLLNISMRIGYNFKKRGRFLTHSIDLPFGFKDKHVARYYLDLLGFLKIKASEYPFEIYISEQDRLRALDIFTKYGLKNHDIILGICPGSGDSWQDSAYYKRWPKENFIRLCNLFNKEKGFKIVLFGSKKEKDLCDEIAKSLDGEPLNLCSKVTLGQFCCLLSLCSLIITNDGGPFHISQSLEKSVIGFFGPVDERVYGVYPGHKNSYAIKSDVSCRPCYKGFKFQGCSLDKKCLRDIDYKYVVSLVEELLNGRN
ncbi:MAG: glycosyltransferase family 9 protein [Candidatus Omnitrophota bacterium]